MSCCFPQNPKLSCVAISFGNWLIPAMAAVFLLALTDTAFAADDAESNLQIVPVGHWTTMFGGDEVQIRVQVQSEQPIEGRIQWRHSANDRTISRGEVPVEIKAAPDGLVTIGLRTPPIRDGIVFASSLNLGFVPSGANHSVAELDRTLWLFPEDPFTGLRPAIEQAGLTVFDPEKRTSDLLKQWKVPFHSVSRIAAIDVAGHLNAEESSPTPILLVGENISLKRQPAVAKQLIHLAQNGWSVVLLSPVDGSLPLPHTDVAPDRIPAGQMLPEVRLRNQTVITDLDKRLDANYWRERDGIPVMHLALENRSRLVSAVVTQKNGWPWLEMHYPESGGRLVVCGFHIIDQWHHGPTPRFLLARILESTLP